MFDQLKRAPRVLLRQELKPIQGERFQPTGFADLGPAVYENHDGTRMLLVESAQSVANRMEAVCMDGTGPEIRKELEGLAYIRVKLTGSTETVSSSLVEAHRINSPFIISNEQFKKAFIQKSEYSKGQPVNWHKVAMAVFFFDPGALLHGAFMANLEDGRIKLPRAITGFIEARDVREAASGGVKNNPLDPTGKIRAANFDKDVYSNVPYARMEFTAREIAAYFNLDIALISGYGLPPEAERLLMALALYKVRRFLNTGLRLRTACDFRAEGPLEVQSPTGFEIPAEPELLALVQEAIRASTAAGLFASPPVTELTTACGARADKAAVAVS
jgi:CRISPR-associated protein Csb1